VKAIGFMIAFLARWQVPADASDAFCDDIRMAAKATLADFAKEDAATEAASAPRPYRSPRATGHQWDNLLSKYSPPPAELRPATRA
jgi:hypothetical protein